MAGRKTDKRRTLGDQAGDILQTAEKKGVSTNFFFRTTFARYQVQMQTLADLEKAINEAGPIVSKEYVKGRKNYYTNPAIGEYNKTATAANNTVMTLLRIIEGFAEIDAESDTKKGKLERLLEQLEA